MNLLPQFYLNYDLVFWRSLWFEKKDANWKSTFWFHYIVLRLLAIDDAFLIDIWKEKKIESSSKTQINYSLRLFLVFYGISVIENHIVSLFETPTITPWLGATIERRNSVNESRKFSLEQHNWNLKRALISQYEAHNQPNMISKNNLISNGR